MNSCESKASSISTHKIAYKTSSSFSEGRMGINIFFIEIDTTSFAVKVRSVNVCVYLNYYLFNLQEQMISKCTILCCFICYQAKFTLFWAVLCVLSSKLFFPTVSIRTFWDCYKKKVYHFDFYFFIFYFVTLKVINKYLFFTIFLLFLLF